MKKSTLRIVCSNYGERHYSASPDVAMDRCPSCAAPTTPAAIELIEPKVITLWDLLSDADAVQIDDFFVRHFHLEQEECEEDDDIVLSIDVEAEATYEFNFSKEELESAVKSSDGIGYDISCNNEGYKLIPYKLTELKA